jgi:lipopolysaccharide transport protein LptA
VKIAQGPLQVEAEEARATGLNFENSKWDLEGQVRITLPDGKLAADHATVSFRDNAVVQAEVRGSPATFEQRLEQSRQLARGHARTIAYDVRAGTVSLAGDAWLTDGESEIRGDTLIYDIGRQRVAANPGATQPGGVRITINPKDKTGAVPTPRLSPPERAP